MAIILVTGTPRSGKTLYCVEQLVKYIHQDELRPLYCDIAGFHSNVVSLPPDDWRQTPEKSVIIYDEVQMRPEYSRHQKGRVDFIEKLQVHGHTGHDIYLITQGVRFLNPDLFPLVTEHIHVHNSFNSKMSSIIYKFRTVQTTLGKSNLNDAEDKTIWRYPKHLFHVYKSATHHTKVFAIPKKVKNAIAVIIAIIVLACYFGYKTFTNQSGFIDGKHQEKTLTSKDKNDSKTDHSTTKDQSKPPEYDRYSRVAFVVRTEYNCYAKNEIGERLDIPLQKCVEYSDHPSLLSPARPDSHDTKQLEASSNEQPLQITGNDPKPQPVSFDSQTFNSQQQPTSRQL